MARAGEGNAWYGERVEDLAESFDAEMSYLSSVVWKQVRVGLSTPLSFGAKEIQVRNDYAKTGVREWAMPSITANSEVWMAISMDMNRVIQMQTTDTVLNIMITAKNTDGIEREFAVRLPKLPWLRWRSIDKPQRTNCLLVAIEKLNQLRYNAKQEPMSKSVIGRR